MRSKCCVHCFVSPCYHHNQLQVNMAMTVFLIYRDFPRLQFIFDRSDINERMSKLKKKGPIFLESFPNLSKIVIYNVRIHILIPVLSVVSFNLGIFDLFTLFFLIFSLKDCYFVTNWTWLSITVEISWPTTNVLWQNLAIYNQSLVWKSTSVLNMDNTAYTYRSKGMIFADVSSNVFVFVILGLFLLKTSMRTKSNVAMGLRKSLNKCASMLLLNWELTAEKCLGISDSLRFLSIKGKQC